MGIKRLNGFDYAIIIFVSLLALLVLYPFYNTVLVSFTSQAEYSRTPFMLFPKEPTLDSYRVVLSRRDVYDSYRVTLIVTLVGVVYNMFLTVLMAYSLTKEFPGKKVITYLVIFTMYFSGGLIPFFLLVRDLGLMDKIASMILPSGMSVAYMTVIRKYIEALPIEMQESARIDGASEFIILFRIILPVAVPMMVTFSLYYGVDRWNEWWYGMLFIRTISKQPLQLFLRGIIMAMGTWVNEGGVANWQDASGIVPFTDGVKMASVVITVIPIMCVYPFIQKYFVQGLAIGAVKG